MDLVNCVTGSEPLNKLPLLIADDLEEHFMREGWPTGRSFGGEAALAERYDVGRDVLREAVRLLEARNHARMRRGPQGGLEVVCPNLGNLLGRLAGYAYVSGLDRARALEMWTILQAVAIQLAISPADAWRTADLRAQIAEGIRRPSFSLHNLGSLMIGASGSKVLMLLGTCVGSLLPPFADAPLDDRTIRQLQELATSPDISPALLSWLRKEQLPAVLAQLVASPAGTLFHLPDLPRDDCFKAQAMQVVHELMSTASPNAWARGHLIGNEFDLADRFGVDKSIVRQAIRLMEDAETATALPGRGRGLVTRLPSTAPLSRLFSAFFIANGVDELDGEQVFRALRIECTGWAAERADSEDCMTLLALCTDLMELAPPLPVAALQSFERFQQHAAHNPLLDLCIDGTKAFLSWRMGKPLIAPRSVVEAYQTHTRRVITAICAHDRAAAMLAEQAKLDAVAHCRRQAGSMRFD
ncbi:GntR family transcriptional regulator [Nitrospirillum viridazoti]|uniref:GntR family transcriptional regulator n=1 Tax=Nitrospirillum viridazoti TaxID=3144925 RepID=UPI000313C472|nr:GntR family transcriptional regulator [Nitrospirillum amazonense]